MRSASSGWEAAMSVSRLAARAPSVVESEDGSAKTACRLRFGHA